MWGLPQLAVMPRRPTLNRVLVRKWMTDAGHNEEAKMPFRLDRRATGQPGPGKHGSADVLGRDHFICLNNLCPYSILGMCQ